MAPTRGVSVDLTTELRWFVDGQLPPELLAWFTRSDGGLIEDRCDTYRFDGRPDVGVKRRFRTMLELKLRLRSPEPFQISQGVDGWLETWQRWSPADDRVDLAPDTVWVDVGKTIVKRRFDRDGREVPLSEETRAMTGEGCDAELAAISVGGHHAWSFAFAAFGPAADHRYLVDVAWRALVGDGDRPPELGLDRARSCGYPEWMARVVAAGGPSGPPAAFAPASSPLAEGETST